VPEPATPADPPSVADSVAIDASADVVWRLISDVTRMPQWSPELIRARWLGPVQEAKVGARFRGTNRHKVFRWSTSCQVTAAEPGTRFAYRVTSLGLPVSEWTFTIRPNAGGCELTEGTVDRRGLIMKTFGPAATGVADRAEHNRAGITATLAAVKAAAEREAATAQT
jgi:uncharacterized protein YndB with AHSA1/START domain